MAGVQETAQWENHVYRIEENDPVHGGENGVTNKPIKHLANRTLYLRRLLTEAGQRINPKKITATSKNSNDLTGHTHEIDHASLTQKGIVQLNASIQSTSTTESATPSAVKAAYDKAATAEQKATLANEKVEAIKVGGRNLLIQSNTPHNGNAYSVRYALAEAPKVGEEIVVTLWGELGSQRTGIGVYNSQGATELAKLVKIRDGVYQGKGIWRKPMSEGRERTPNDTHLNVYFYPKTATDNNRIERIQLERGSIGTDWTPNEADLKAEISAIRTKLIPVRGGNVATTLNAAKRSDWFREMQIPYQSGWGYYTQAFHNSGTQHNYSNLPLTGRYYFIAELYHNSGYSHLRITYPSLKRTFESAINLNNEDLILDWREVVFLKDGLYQGTFKTTGTLESAYRLRAARDDERYQPYLQMVDMGYDLANPPVGKNKIIGSVDYYVKNGTSESSKATMMAAAMPDKNVFWEVALWNAAQQRNVLFKGYSKTNNLSIGKTTDNERDRVQVNGTIQATAPADNANNDQVPTTAWVRKMAKILADGKVSKAGDTMTGHLFIKNGEYSAVHTYNTSGWFAKWEAAPLSDSHFAAIVYANDRETVINRVLIPKKNGTVALINDIADTVRAAVSRSDKSRSRTFPLQTGKKYTTTGSVTIYPDGRIVQIFHLKNIKAAWFDYEASAVGDRHRVVNIPLWTAMPNKIFDVDVKTVRPSNNASTYYIEAAEWLSAWQIYGNDTNKSSVNINLSRFRGGKDEDMDLYVTVEGY
ncbi:TPA: tail fiber protein [Mannheimia haemolytica]|uniref:Phage tail protein n=3 Tax=Mannheimia haemolytica TaxID=75985 RepID=A0A547ERN6_MANHA|nr:phage tail protein [Mannheimia haemolytica]AWW72160.1 phage tail protein [Pasteurellaceae bacterium 12565]AGI33451.1 phage tail protein [Mannheimia haemolytica USDA-ARS-USMARC-183]AGK01632.1 phage-like tail fiber protein [Mannheimia haemolytica M42548]AGQ26439.1 phage tail protein [Mannheimia haemolytica D153]AGQ41982.1 phage tail protein [Mannheimia haemolytica D174]